MSMSWVRIINNENKKRIHGTIVKSIKNVQLGSMAIEGKY